MVTVPATPRVAEALNVEEGGCFLSGVVRGWGQVYDGGLHTLNEVAHWDHLIPQCLPTGLVVPIVIYHSIRKLVLRPLPPGGAPFGASGSPSPPTPTFNPPGGVCNYNGVCGIWWWKQHHRDGLGWLLSFCCPPPHSQGGSCLLLFLEVHLTPDSLKV